MVDARAQISQRLAGSGAGDPNGLLARLAAVGPAFSNSQGVTLKSLAWRSGQLDLRVGAPSSEVLARMHRTSSGLACIRMCSPPHRMRVASMPSWS